MFKRTLIVMAMMATLGAGSLMTPDTADARRWRRGPYYRSYYAPPRAYYYSRPYRTYYGTRYYAAPGYGRYYGTPRGYYGPRYYGGRSGATFWFGF